MNLGSCGRVARQSSAKAFTPVRIWSGPLIIKKFNFIFLKSYFVEKIY